MAEKQQGVNYLPTIDDPEGSPSSEDFYEYAADLINHNTSASGATRERMYNLASLEAERARNKFSAEQADLAYNRSKATNQVAQLMAAGMSRAQALAVLSGGATATPATTPGGFAPSASQNPLLNTINSLGTIAGIASNFVGSALPSLLISAGKVTAGKATQHVANWNANLRALGLSEADFAKYSLQSEDFNLGWNGVADKIAKAAGSDIPKLAEFASNLVKSQDWQKANTNFYSQMACNEWLSSYKNGWSPIQTATELSNRVARDTAATMVAQMNEEETAAMTKYMVEEYARKNDISQAEFSNTMWELQMLAANYAAVDASPETKQALIDNFLMDINNRKMAAFILDKYQTMDYDMLLDPQYSFIIKQGRFMQTADVEEKLRGYIQGGAVLGVSGQYVSNAVDGIVDTTAEAAKTLYDKMKDYVSPKDGQGNFFTRIADKVAPKLHPSESRMDAFLRGFTVDEMYKDYSDDELNPYFRR